MNIEIPFSEACERNKDPILSVISEYLSSVCSVLEIGSGTAQHAVYFAKANPHLQWQTSDQAQYLDGIRAQLHVAEVGNVLAPIQLNVNQDPWVADNQEFPFIYSANTLHIMTSDDVIAFFNGLPKVAEQDAVLVIYGPFKYQGKFTSDSNYAFDQSLRARGVGSAIRDFEWVNDLAQEQGFELIADHAMPANNQCLIWKRRVNEQ